MKILLIEDDADLSDIITFALRRRGHDVEPTRDAPSGLRLWQSRAPDLILLDLDLPSMSGWEVCRRIRAASAVPVIVLSAARREEDILAAFDLGADDYITKPFSPRQLLARVDALLRRTVCAPAGRRPAGPEPLTIGGLTVDPGWCNLTCGTRSVRLTPTEARVLTQLMLHRDQVLPYDVLAQRVWGHSQEPGDTAVLLKGHIRNLRRKLAATGADPESIATMPQVGYCFQQPAAQPA